MGLFTPKNWQNAPSTATPISEAALEDLENRVTDYTDAVVPNVYFPEAYGAAGDGVTDDTTAFKNMMQDIEDSGISGDVVLAAGKTYLLNGAPDHTKSGNAIVPLPFTSGVGGGPGSYPFPTQSPDLRFRSSGRGKTILKTTRNTDTYSASWGSPSMVGGPTPEQAGDSPNTTLGSIRFQGVGFQTPANPKISCLDAYYTQTTVLDDFQISTAETSEGPDLVTSPDDVTVPTNKWTFGVRTGWAGPTTTRDVRIHGGPYVGIVLPGSHQLINAAIQFVAVAFAWPDTIGNGTLTQFPFIIVANVKYGFAGWNPTSGAVSLSSPSIAGIRSGFITMEHTSSPSVWEYTAFLLDANHCFLGWLQYAYWGLAFDHVLPTITGGGRMDFIDGTDHVSGKELGYAEITSNATNATTTFADVAGLSTTVVTYGRPVWVEVYCPGLSNSAASGGAQVQVLEGATTLGIVCVQFAATGNDSESQLGRVKRTPSAGSHTYKAQLRASVSGTATLAAGAGGAATRVAAYIRVVAA